MFVVVSSLTSKVWWGRWDYRR